MNVLFHTTTAIGIAVTLIDANFAQYQPKKILALSSAAFIMGVISHGVLDFMPHCYPINSKIDVLLGLVMMIVFTLLAHRKVRLMVGFAFLGSIFPDIIDLLPQILNKYMGFRLPIHDKIFPWHWKQYSGSIFVEDCEVSRLNHALLLFIVGMICWFRRKVLSITH
jgi:hypothetical protein